MRLPVDEEVDQPNHKNFNAQFALPTRLAEIKREEEIEGTAKQ